MADGLGWPHPPLWAPWWYNWWLACSRGSTSVEENFPLTSQLFHLLPNVSPLLYSKTSWKELSILTVSTSSHPTFFLCPLKITSVRLSPLLYNDTAFVRVTDDLHIAKYSGDLAVFLLIPAIHWATSSSLNTFSYLRRHLSLWVLLPHLAALLRPLCLFLLIPLTCIARVPHSKSHGLLSPHSFPGWLYMVPWLEISTFMLAAPKLIHLASNSPLNSRFRFPLPTQHLHMEVY